MNVWRMRLRNFGKSEMKKNLSVQKWMERFMRSQVTGIMEIILGLRLRNKSQVSMGSSLEKEYP